MIKSKQKYKRLNNVNRNDENEVCIAYSEMIRWDK